MGRVFTDKKSSFFYRFFSVLIFQIFFSKIDQILWIAQKKNHGAISHDTKYKSYCCQISKKGRYQKRKKEKKMRVMTHDFNDPKNFDDYKARPRLPFKIALPTHLLWATNRSSLKHSHNTSLSTTISVSWELLPSGSLTCKERH